MLKNENWHQCRALQAEVLQVKKNQSFISKINSTNLLFNLFYTVLKEGSVMI